MEERERTACFAVTGTWRSGLSRCLAITLLPIAHNEKHTLNLLRTSETHTHSNTVFLLSLYYHTLTQYFIKSYSGVLPTLLF